MNRYTRGTLATQVVVVLAAAAFMFPLYVFVASSLKPLREIAASPLAPPSSPRFANYAEAWTEGGLGGALLGSTLVAVASIAVLVAIGSTAAYPLARRRGRLSAGLYLLFLLGIVLPFQVALIPVYQLMRNLGLLGSYWSLVLWYSGLLAPVTVFLYTGFLRMLPRDYEDAALVDGASRGQAFRHVVFPLMAPVTGTVVILDLLLIWNDFLTPFLFLSGSGRTTVPVAVYGFVGQYVSEWGLLFAAMVIGVLPVVVLYTVMSRRVIRAIGSGIKA